MNLLPYLLKQTQLWNFVFPQARSAQRAIGLAFGILCGLGTRTLTRAISFQGNTQKDWSADYKVFSRSDWQPRALFHPILQHAIAEQKLERICPLLVSWVHPLAPEQQDKSLKKVPAGQTLISRQDLAEKIIADALPVRFQVQMHKVIWAPEQRGV